MGGVEAEIFVFCAYIYWAYACEWKEVVRCMLQPA